MHRTVPGPHRNRRAPVCPKAILAVSACILQMSAARCADDCSALYASLVSDHSFEVCGECSTSVSRHPPTHSIVPSRPLSTYRVAVTRGVDVNFFLTLHTNGPPPARACMTGWLCGGVHGGCERPAAYLLLGSGVWVFFHSPGRQPTCLLPDLRHVHLFGSVSERRTRLWRAINKLPMLLRTPSLYYRRFIGPYPFQWRLVAHWFGSAMRLACTVCRYRYLPTPPPVGRH